MLDKFPVKSCHFLVPWYIHIKTITQFNFTDKGKPTEINLDMSGSMVPGWERYHTSILKFKAQPKSYKSSWSNEVLTLRYNLLFLPSWPIDVKEGLDWCPKLHCYTHYKYPSYKWGFNKGVHVSEPLENLIKVLWHFALHWKKAVWESNQICENSFKMSSDQGPGKNNLYNSATVIYI